MGEVQKSLSATNSVSDSYRAYQSAQKAYNNTLSNIDQSITSGGISTNELYSAGESLQSSSKSISTFLESTVNSYSASGSLTDSEQNNLRSALVASLQFGFGGSVEESFTKSFSDTEMKAWNELTSGNKTDQLTVMGKDIPTMLDSSGNDRGVQYFGDDASTVEALSNYSGNSLETTDTIRQVGQIDSMGGSKYSGKHPTLDEPGTGNKFSLSAGSALNPTEEKKTMPPTVS